MYDVYNIMAANYCEIITIITVARCS